MKKIIKGTIKACLILGLGVVLFGCSMQLGSVETSEGSSSVNNIRSMMNRSDSEKLLYMGGSVLYSPKDPNANQLIPGAVIATRIGKVEKSELGAGQYAYKNSKTDYELGFISVDSISKSEICNILPDVSPTTVELVLGKMVKAGQIKTIGRGRNTRYRKI